MSEQAQEVGLIRLREQVNPGHGVVQIVEPVAKKDRDAGRVYNFADTQQKLIAITAPRLDPADRKTQGS